MVLLHGPGGKTAVRLRHSLMIDRKFIPPKPERGERRQGACGGRGVLRTNF